MLTWAHTHRVALQLIEPGKPNQNALVERFNRTYREEVLDQHLFTSLDDVREATYWWQTRRLESEAMSVDLHAG